MTVETAQQLLAKLTASVSGGNLGAAATALRSLKICFTALPALQPLAVGSPSASAERGLAMRTYEQAVLLSLAQKDQRTLQVSLLCRAVALLRAGRRPPPARPSRRRATAVLLTLPYFSRHPQGAPPDPAEAILLRVRG